MGIGGPACADDGAKPGGGDGVGRSTHESGIGLAVFGGGGVMVARALVAQGAVDDDEVRGRSGRHDLSGRCDAQQQAAPAGKQFLRDQDSGRRADGAANDPGRLARERRSVELGVIAGPAVERFGSPLSPQLANHIAVRIEDADRGHIDGGQRLLRRASRSKASGRNTDGELGFLSRMTVMGLRRAQTLEHEGVMIGRALRRCGAPCLTRESAPWKTLCSPRECRGFFVPRPAGRRGAISGRAHDPEMKEVLFS